MYPGGAASRAEHNRLVTHFAKHEKIRMYESHTEKIHSVGWSCDGARLASGSLDKTINIYLLDTDKNRFYRDSSLRGHVHQVDQLCWHPSHPDQLVSAGGDKTARIWDARTKKQVAQTLTKGDNINVTWSPDGKTIAVGNKDDLVQFIDVRMNKIVASEQFKYETNEISWNNTNTHFFLTNGIGQILVLTWPELKHVLTLPAHPSNIICIKFDPTGDYFAVGATDGIVSIWDVHNLVCLRTVTKLEWPIRAVSFSHDGKLLASGSEDLAIHIANTETGAKVCDVKCLNPTFTVAWHPSEYLLAFACDDKGKMQVYGFPSSDSS